MGRIITFYSYKGGTGRSMALANVAWILASAGHRVLAIDWDLEAPGLHRYFHPFLSDKELTGQESQGVIDMAIDFAVRSATPVPSGEKRTDDWYEIFADFSKWRQQLRWPSGEAIHLGRGGKGEIDFVPAGRQGPDYAKRVNHFDWRRFYENLGGGAFFDAARRNLSAYDYVLIDSRTGVSDTSGICTVQMPDTLVVCFTLNYQSIKGAYAVAQSVKEQRPDIRIFPLPTRVDGSEEKLLRRMKTYATGLFGPLLDNKTDASDYWFSMEVPYFARYAYAEKLALFEEQSSITASTLPAMTRLANYLTDGAARKMDPLPNGERIAALTDFEGPGETDPTASPSTKRQERSPASTQYLPPSASYPSASTSLSRKSTSLRIFLSYAAEDRLFAQAVNEALHRVGGPLNLAVFDSDAIGAGSFASELLSSVLEEADLLIVVDIGASKRTEGHERIGAEAGFFSALMREGNGRRRASERQIVVLSTDPQTFPANAFRWVDLSIVEQDLKGTADDYLRKSADRREDPLIRFFHEIAVRADEMNPERSDKNWILEFDGFLTKEIIPTLRRHLFNCLQTSRAYSIEPRQIEFELPAASEPIITALPPDTRLTSSSDAFRIFGLSSRDTYVTWQELRKELRNPSMLDVVEQVVVRATSSDRPESSVMRSDHGVLFDVIFARSKIFYDGRRIIEIYFVEKMRQVFVSRNTSIALAIINRAARYSFIFELQSPVSIDAFTFETSPADFKNKVSQLIQQLRAAENEAVEYGLDDLRTLIDIGGRRSSLTRIEPVLRQERASRAHLAELADKIATAPLDDTTAFEALKKAWLATLEEYRESVSTLQERVLAPAFDALRETFGTGPDGPTLLSQ